MDLAISPGSIWKVGVRSLTNIGALTATPTVATSLAGGTSVDLRPAGGLCADSTISVLTGAGATLASTIDHFDGTNAITITATAAAAGAATAFSVRATSSVGPRVRNTDATHAASYIVSGFTWSI